MDGHEVGGGGLRLLHNTKAWTTGVITDCNSSDHLVLKGQEFPIPAFLLNNAVLCRGPHSCEQPVVRLSTLVIFTNPT
jgi:hypothetical protein